MQRYWLSSPEAAAKTVRFIDTYRSYVINYNLGRDMVADWVARTGGRAEDAPLARVPGAALGPHLPRDLR